MVFLRFVFALILILLVLPMVVHAETVGSRSCLATHVKDAIQINKTRAPLYEALTNGKSKYVTMKLLQMENRLLWQAPFADLWALPYQRAGIPILCADVVDMALTPKFVAANPKGKASLKSFVPAKIDEIEAELWRLYKAKDYQSLARQADRYVHELDQEPRYNCLVKHMLESIRRFAGLIPIHRKTAEMNNALAPLNLSKVLIKTHLRLLKGSQEIDILAAPLQAQGVMMVCQDVPHIPAP